MRIITRSGPWISAMPLAAGSLGDCRMCRENREVGDQAVRLVHEGRGAEALGIAHEWAEQIDGHSCKKWVDSALMPPKRGRWLSVRVEIPVWDFVLQDAYRLPVARADCLAVGGTGDCPDSFVVLSTPGSDDEGRVAQWFLAGLDKDERRALLADLKEV